MAFERRNPLPTGRYWIDVSGETRMQEFSAWQLQNRGKVAIEASETSEEPAALWALFQVSEPVFFPSANFGFPTIATTDIRTKADTVQKPDVKEPTTEDVVSGIVTFGKLTLGAAALLLLARIVGGRK